MVSFEPHFLGGGLSDRRTITVKGIASLRLAPVSAASTSVREAHDDSRGWGGSISCGYTLLCLLTQKTTEQFGNHFSSSSHPTTNGPTNNPEERQPPRRDPRSVPISAYTRSACQGSVQQCCHRSGDQLATSPAFYLSSTSCLSSQKHFQVQACSIRHSPIGNTRGCTLVTHVTSTTCPRTQAVCLTSHIDVG